MCGSIGIKARLFKFMGRQESGSSNLETFIFASSDYLSNEDKLLLLVHGSGVVRAGQWARRLVLLFKKKTEIFVETNDYFLLG